MRDLRLQTSDKYFGVGIAIGVAIGIAIAIENPPARERNADFDIRYRLR